MLWCRGQERLQIHQRCGNEGAFRLVSRVVAIAGAQKQRAGCDVDGGVSAAREEGQHSAQLGSTNLKRHGPAKR